VGERFRGNEVTRFRGGEVTRSKGKLTVKDNEVQVLD